MKKLITTIYPALAMFAFAHFGFLPRVQAVSPTPDGGYPGGNTAEGQNALLSLTTGGYNTAVGFLSLVDNTIGALNTGVGAGALLINTGNKNTALGAAALLSNTTGAENTASGAFALFTNNSGSDNTANGVNALELNTAGSDNTATGVNALLSNTSGIDNTADGVGALQSNTDGMENTATGVAALESNNHGGQNTAIGVNALLNTIDGSGNTACGYSALLSNNTGSNDTAVGHGALGSLTAGNNNTALGVGAGSALTTGDANIDIGNAGVAGESGSIRIGDSTFHTATYIAGIAGQTVGAGGTTCYVDNAGRLGVLLSALRYKQNIQPMDEASAALYSLKPVTFRYKPEFDRSDTPQFGLVAEEVAKVSPNLVTHDSKGDLSTVRYEAVNVMLLNEFLKEHMAFLAEKRKIQDQAAVINELKTTVAHQQNSFRSRFAEQEKQIKALASNLQRISAQIEVHKPQPTVVVNTP